MYTTHDKEFSNENTSGDVMKLHVSKEDISAFGELDNESMIVENDNEHNLTSLTNDLNNIVIGSDDNNIDDDMISDYKYNELLSKINQLEMTLQEIIQILGKIKFNSNNNINNNNNIPKYDKITYNHDKEEKPYFITNFPVEYMRILINNDIQKFGKLVGKNGANIKRIYNKFGVRVFVPQEIDSKYFPAVIMIKDKYASNENFEDACKLVNNKLSN